MKLPTLRRASKMAWRGRWRAVAAVMVPVYFVTSLPPGALAATNTGPSYPSPVLTPDNVQANQNKPQIQSYAGVQIPSLPTEHDITCSHAFAEPLLPVGGSTTPAENQTLGADIKVFLQRDSDEDVEALTGFLQQYSHSAWRPSLDLNLGEIYYRTGNFSKALEAWQDAWDSTQSLKDAAGQQVANLAVAKLARMQARIGRTSELDTLFQQIKGRSISGVAAQELVNARAGLWLMKTRPQDAFRCGPSALQELSLATKHKITHPEILNQSRSTPQGIALSDVQTLAGQIDMPMQMAKRSTGASFIVPAVIHWKLGHYAALVGQRNGKYEVHDTTFGGAKFLVSAKALEQETSGYFLVPAGALPQGWTSVGKKEGSQVYGRGNTGLQFDMCYGANAGFSGGDCGSGGDGIDEGPTGISNPDGTSSGANKGDHGDWTGANQVSDTEMPAMTEPEVNAMLVSLNLVDTPVRYAPSVGPAMHFTVQYNQREIAQPSTFTYANLGPNWTFSYVSYVKPETGQAEVYERGGGVETFNYNSSTNSYSPSQVTEAVLSQVNSTTWQKTMPSGDIETFAQPDGAGNFFLTQITDAQGNSLKLTYDSYFRLSYLTDALGQVTTVTYESNTSTNLPAFYEIAKVTDPFGRAAQFSYDGSGRLQQITDILGITSQFTYSGTFVTSLTTPYGVTSFAYGDISTDPNLGSTRWLNTTYPDGNTTRTEFNQNQVPSGVTVSGGNYTDTVGVPHSTTITMYSGVSGGGNNQYMNDRNTYYWDKQAMASHAGDYTQAQVTHWLHTSDSNTCSDIQESLKKADQNRIWYGYTGQLQSIQASETMIAKPTQKGRMLGTGSATLQLFTYQYNTIGKMTQQIDPLGRETDYAYAANNIDLLTVKQKNGSSSDLLATYTYNNQHEVLTAVDASGQTTTYTYYPNGKPQTVTNALGQTTTCGYDAHWNLTSVTGPVSGATTKFTYDGYNRVRTVTDSQGYMTTTNYDVMDRPTYVIYPDATTSQFVYSNLDVQRAKDRLGRWTRYFYNSVRQPIATVDSQGNATSTTWSLSAGPLSIFDAKGNMTSWSYDNQNRVIGKTYPDGTSEAITYEATTSRVATTTDANGSVATMTYNVDNTVASVSYSAGSGVVATPTDSYTYDSVYPRVLTAYTGTGSGTTITYNYNTVTGTVGSGKLGSVAMPLATINYTSYDALGRLLSQNVGGGPASSVTYDALGRVATATDNALSSTAFTYSYLGNTGRVSSLSYPNGQVTDYTYQDSTTAGEPRLAEIKNLNASSGVISKFDYGYDAQGQITSWTQLTGASGDPQNWAMLYDQEGKLLNVNQTDTTTSAVVHQYAYTYDPAGNRTSEQIDGNSVSSSYNNLNQLTGQSAGGSMVFAGSINPTSTVTVQGTNTAPVDAYNNFRGTAVVSSGTNDVPIVATNPNGGHATTNTYQVVIAPTSGSYTYDHNGNLLTDGTRTFYYDAKNEMVGIVYASTHTDFTYDVTGARVAIIERSGTTLGSGTASSTKQFVGNEERDASGTTVTNRFYPQGEERIVSGTGTSYYYTFDHLGSIREMVASNGTTIEACYGYDPYGRTTLVSGTDLASFQYAGMYKHQTSGLYLTDYRAYDPNTARWLSRDPAGEFEVDDDDDDDGTVGGMNLYGYVDGDPINFYDSDGLGKQGARNADRGGHRGKKNSDKHGNAQGHGGRTKPNFTPKPKRGNSNSRCMDSPTPSPVPAPAVPSPVPQMPAPSPDDYPSPVYTPPMIYIPTPTPTQTAVGIGVGGTVVIIIVVIVLSPVGA